MQTVYMETVFSLLANDNPPLEMDTFAHTLLPKSLFYTFLSFHLIPLLVQRQGQLTGILQQCCDMQNMFS